MQINFGLIHERRIQLECNVEKAHQELYKLIGKLEEINELEGFAKVPIPSTPGETYKERAEREIANIAERIKQASALTDGSNTPVEDALEAKE